jgi:hypothetical protein
MELFKMLFMASPVCMYATWILLLYRQILQALPVVCASCMNLASHVMAPTLYTNPHSIILYQQTVMSISTAVRTLDLTSNLLPEF